MIKIKIDKTKDRYILPTSIDEIGFGKGMEISKLLKKNNKTINDKRNIISILIDCKFELLLNIDDEWINLIYSKLHYLENDTDITNIIVTNSFKLNKKYYSLKPIEEFSVLEYIDFTNLFNTKNIEDNYHQILSFIIRESKVKQSIKDKILTYIINFKSKLKKQYKLLIESSNIISKYDGLNYNLENNDIYNSLPFMVALSIINTYTKTINNIGYQYPNLYQIDTKADLFNKNKHKDAFEVYKPIDVFNPLKQFGLYNSLDDITNGNKIEIDYWLNKNFRELLSHLEFTIIKNKHHNSK